MTCPHEDWSAFVDVQRIVTSLPGQPMEPDPAGDLEAITVEVRVHCTACDEPLVFRGLPVGLMSDRPCISPDGRELRVPARPQSADPHFGLGLPGFIARVSEGQQGHDN